MGNARDKLSNSCQLLRARQLPVQSCVVHGHARSPASNSILVNSSAFTADIRGSLSPMHPNMSARMERSATRT